MLRLLIALTFAMCAVLRAPIASAVEQVYFTSPNGNIGCFMDPWHVRCDIRDRSWTPPPRPASCPEFGDYAHDYGQGIVLNADDPAGPQFTCANDSVFGAGSALPYGQTMQLDSIRCQTSPTGVSCSDFLNGRGFSMSRDSYYFV